MTLKEFFITGGYSKKFKAHMRPLWLMILLTPVALLYHPANAFVRFCDRNL